MREHNAVACDAKGCGQKFEVEPGPDGFRDPELARRLAQGAGWWTDGDEWDLCPNHRPPTVHP